MQEYKELREAFPHLGVQYTPAPEKGGHTSHTNQKDPVHAKPPRNKYVSHGSHGDGNGGVVYTTTEVEEPPRIEEVYEVPRKYRAKTIGDNDSRIRGRFIPGGL